MTRLTDPQSPGTEGMPNPRISLPQRPFRIAAKTLFWIVFAIVATHFFLRLYPHFTEPGPVPPPRLDFTAFWAAAKLAAQGQGLSAFQHDAILAAAGLPPDVPNTILRWLYPAGFLVILLPLGLLPYWQAVLIYVAWSAGALVLALRGPAAGIAGATQLFIASPAIVIGSYLIGQTSALWTAALLAALWAMRSGNTFLAALFIAALTLKPQLGLIIPFALVASRQWQTIAWSTAFALLMLAATTLAFGAEYWSSFFSSMSFIADMVADGGVAKLQLMTSVYGLLRASTLDHIHAVAVQFVVTAFVAIAIVYVWRGDRISVDLKCATLCTAIPLSTPYAYYYEMALTLAAALFLIRSGFGASWLARFWLTALWLGPLPSFLLTDDWPLPVVAPVMMLITFMICLSRAHRESRMHQQPVRPANGMP